MADVQVQLESQLACGLIVLQLALCNLIKEGHSKGQL